jgi:hypothetical protein
LSELKFKYSTWCKKQLSKQNIEIYDLSNTWKSGIAFCALFDSFVPNIIQFEQLSIKNYEQNLQLAFDLAFKHLKIPKILDPTDVATFPDENSILLYLSYFRRLEFVKTTKIQNEEDPKIEELNTVIASEKIQKLFISFVKSNSLIKIGFEEQKLLMKEFEKIYEDYKKGTFECAELDDMLYEGLEKSKNSDILSLLKNGSFLRSEIPQDRILKELKTAFDNVEFSEELENYIEENAKKKKKLKQIRSEIYDNLLYELYIDWKDEKSNFMKEIDKILNFKSKNNERSKSDIVKMIKIKKIPEVDFSEILSDFETRLYCCRDYFAICDGGEADLLNVFFHLSWENHQMKEEMKSLNKKNEKLEKDLKELKRIVYSMMKRNPEVPEDAVFIES